MTEILNNFKLKRKEIICNIIFCNIINVLTVTFDQFNVSLLNKSMNIFKKKSSNLLKILNSSIT